MGISMILSLLPAIIGAFSGKAQAQAAPILSQLGGIAPGATPAAGSKEDAIIAFATQVMGMVLGAAGHPGAATPTAVSDAEKVQATAKVLASPALVQQVEDTAMQRLEKMGPTFDRLIAIDKATNEASVSGKDAAAARSLLDRWDMTETLVKSSEYLTYLIVVLGGFLIGAAIYKDKWEVALSVLAVVGGWITLILRNRSQAYDYRFDGTPSSNAANAINAEIASKK